MKDVNTKAFHFAMMSSLGITQDQYADRLENDDDFKHEVTAVLAGWKLGLGFFYASLLENSKLTQGVPVKSNECPVNLSVDSWVMFEENAPKSVQEAIDNFLVKCHLVE